VKHLLDVNVLLAAIWTQHPQHAVAFAWLAGKEVVVCPLAELGFVRISTHKKAFNFPMDKARELLATFIAERKATRIADDLPALDSKPDRSEHVTDFYLADLAAKHGLRFATLDAGIKHAAVEFVS
jgi:toxin-antitoxin system PIN domain toxin